MTVIGKIICDILPRSTRKKTIHLCTFIALVWRNNSTWGESTGKRRFNFMNDLLVFRHDTNA